MLFSPRKLVDLTLCCGLLATIAALDGTQASAKSSSTSLECQSTSDPKTGDRVTYKHSKDQLLIRVDYRRGIGGAKLTRGKEPWPAKIVVELKNFHNLEAFAVSSGVFRFQTSLKSAPMIWGRDSLKDDTEHQLTGQVKVVQKKDKIVVTVPKETFDWNVDQLKIGWIDAYRH